MATKFIDENEKEWLIEILIGGVKEIRKIHDVDILADWEHEDTRKNLVERIRRDLVLFGDIMAVVVMGGATEELYRGLRGDGLARARNAFMEELIHFFPEPSKREALRLAWEKTEEVSEKGWRKLGASLSNISAETLLSKSSETISSRAIPGNSLNNGRESSESTPTDIPGDSTR